MSKKRGQVGAFAKSRGRAKDEAPSGMRAEEKAHIYHGAGRPINEGIARVRKKSAGLQGEV